MKTTIIAILGLMGCAPNPTDLVPHTAISSCTVKVSGAASGGDSNCVVAGGWNNQSDLTFGVSDRSGAFSFGGNLSSTKEFTARTWDDSNALGGGAQYQVGDAVWAFVLNATNHDPPDQGSFSLTIDDPGPETVGNDSSTWISPKGELTIHLTAVPKTGATGEVIADVSFN
jgi:hypothetical protein